MLGESLSDLSVLPSELSFTSTLSCCCCVSAGSELARVGGGEGESGIGGGGMMISTSVCDKGGDSDEDWDVGGDGGLGSESSGWGTLSVGILTGGDDASLTALSISFL